VEMARYIILQTNLPRSMWTEALISATSETEALRRIWMESLIEASKKKPYVDLRIFEYIFGENVKRVPYPYHLC